MCNANWRGKELDLPTASHSREDRLDGGHQSASRIDLGSSQSFEGFRSGMCGQCLQLSSPDDRC